MAIGTDDGQYHEDGMSMRMAQTDFASDEVKGKAKAISVRPVEGDPQGSPDVEDRRGDPLGLSLYDVFRQKLSNVNADVLDGIQHPLTRQEPLAVRSTLRENPPKESPLGDQLGYSEVGQNKDYDYDAWRKANPGVEMQPGQHYPDTYKLPNHMTFSDESVYHGQNGEQGGHWDKDDQGKWSFTPGPSNLKYHSIYEMKDYFNKVEPDSTLKLPPGASQELTDAFNSYKGTQTPERPGLSMVGAISDFAKRTGSELSTALSSLKGMTNPSFEEDKNLLSGFYNTVKNAFKLPGDVYGGKIDPMSEQGIQRANDLAGLMVFGPMPVAQKMADGTLGSFAGVKAARPMGKLNDLGNAQVWEAEGAHPDEILKETGFFRGADGRWRFEIDDSKSSFDRQWHKDASDKAQDLFKRHGISLDYEYGRGNLPNAYRMRKWGTQEKVNPEDLPKHLKGEWDRLQTGEVSKPLSEVLDHPDLYKAYPWLKDVNVVLDKKTKAGGFWDASNNSIHINPLLAQDHGTLMHEIQHAIQDREGFAKGGAPGKAGQNYELKYNPTEYMINRYSAMNKMFDKLTPEQLKEHQWLSKIFSTYKRYADAGDLLAAENYLRLAGETESRNVEARLLLTDEERRQIPPWSTQDVKYRDQIIKSHPELMTPYNAGDTQRLRKVQPQSADVSSFRRGANDNLSKFEDIRDIVEKRVKEGSVSREAADNMLDELYAKDPTVYNPNDRFMIGSKELDDALGNQWNQMAEQHNKFIELYDKLHAYGEHMVKKENYSEVSVAKYNKLGRELAKHQGTEWEDVKYTPPNR